MPVRTIHRLAAIAGLLCALALCFNAARRGGLVPNTDLTRALAPLAQLFGLWLLTALYTVSRERTGVLGFVGFALNSLGVAGLVGVEYIVNLVLPHLPPEQTAALLAGSMGSMFRVTQVVFLLGALVFAAALLRAGQPFAAVAMYAVGSVAIGLRGVLPDFTVNPGLVLLAAGLGWLALTLYRTETAPAAQPAGFAPGRR